MLSAHAKALQGYMLVVRQAQSRYPVHDQQLVLRQNSTGYPQEQQHDDDHRESLFVPREYLVVLEGGFRREEELHMGDVADGHLAKNVNN